MYISYVCSVSMYRLTTIIAPRSPPTPWADSQRNSPKQLPDWNLLPLQELDCRNQSKDDSPGKIGEMKNETESTIN
jgi:hypothetical protein